MIDFGLSYSTSLAEDKAVDLYVLERAITSAHSDLAGLARSSLSRWSDCSALTRSRQFESILQEYRAACKGCAATVAKFAEGAHPSMPFPVLATDAASFAVRLRGRKRSMVG